MQGLVCKRIQYRQGRKSRPALMLVAIFRPEPSAFAALHAKRESVMKVLDLNYIGQLE